jgi:hypothetical protein
MIPFRPGPPGNRSSARRFVGLVCLALLILAGCDRDEIRQYQVPRISPLGTDAQSAQSRIRLLGAVASHGKEAWLFKLSGAKDAVDGQADNFTALVKSLRFPKTADKPIEWTLPPGWAQDGPSDKLVAILHAGPKGTAPEVTVTKLAPAPALLDVVNLWRRTDLGLPPLDDDELDGVVRAESVAARVVPVVNMVGPGVVKHEVVKPKASKLGRPGKSGATPTYKAPKDWQEIPPTREALMFGRFASFRAQEGTQSANVVLSQMGRNFGDLRGNLDRWRKEVGLGPINDQELTALTIPTLAVDGAQGQYLDINGRGSRMLIVWVPHGGATWFFKMVGPPALVGNQKATFEAFIKTVKFSGGRGGSDE